MPASAICALFRRNPGTPVPGMLNACASAAIAEKRQVGGSLQRRVDQIAVEDHVQVFVSRDSGEQSVGDGILGESAGVAVSDSGGQFLKCHVHERPHYAFVAGGPPRLQRCMRSRSSATGSTARDTIK
jgi:hypothetical protein